MKNKTILNTVFYIVLLVAAFLISFIKIGNYSYLITNNIKMIVVDLALSALLFILYAFLHKGFTIVRKPVFAYLWSILVLGIYFLIGYIFADIFLVKQQLIWTNLLSISLLTILGIILWCLLYFSKKSYSGGWITIKDMEWVIYTGLFPYSLPLADYVHNKKIKQLLIFVPVLPIILVWLGMELKR